jgi:WD40 repeat protein
MNKLRSVLRPLGDRLLAPAFGDDIFVSYSRTDGATYAAGLASQLASEEFACRIDRWGTEAGENLPDSLERALRRSALLVLVGTVGAAQSKNVAYEVETFKKTGRYIVPIIFDKVRLNDGFVHDDVYHRASADPNASGDRALWANEIFGMPLELEASAALTSGTPASQVLNRIRKTFTYQKKDARLRRAARLLLILFGVLAVAVGVTAFIANDRAIAAKDASAAAKQAQTDLKNTQTRNADLHRQQKALETTLSGLGVQLQDAQGLEQAARNEQRLAESERSRAVTGVFAANAARISANKTNSDELGSAVSEALQNYVRLKPENKEIPSALHVALTDAIIQSRRRGRRFGTDRYPLVNDAAVSSNGLLLASAGALRWMNGERQQGIVLWNPATGDIVKEIDSNLATTSCALSRDLSKLAVSYENCQIALFAQENRTWQRRWSRSLTSPVRVVRFAPAEKYLFALTDDNLLLLDVRTGNPAQVEVPQSTWQLVQQTNFQGLSDPAPAIVGAWERKKNGGVLLTATHTDTAISFKVDLDQPKIRRFTGKNGIGFLSTPLIDPNGRWLVVIRRPTDAFQENTYLIDLECVADVKRSCTSVYVLDTPTLDHAFQGGFTPDGKYLVMSGTLQQLHVWNLDAIEKNATKPAVIAVKRGVPYVKEFGATSDHVVLLVTDTPRIGQNEAARQIEVWSLSDRPELTKRTPIFEDEFTTVNPLNLEIREAAGGAFYAIFSKFGRGFYVSEPDSSGGPILRTPEVDLGTALDVAAAHDGTFAAIVHAGGKIAIWTLSEPDIAGVLQGFRGGVAAMTWAHSQDKPVLYAASKKGQLIRWAGGDRVTRIAVPNDLADIIDLQASLDGSVIVLRDKSGAVALWRDGRWREFLLEPDRALAVSTDGGLYSVEGSDGSVNLFAFDGTCRAILQSPMQRVRFSKLTFAASDTRVVGTGFLDRRTSVIVWDVRGGAPLSEVRRASGSVVPAGTTVSPALLWAAENEGATELIDVQTGRTIASIPERSPFFVHVGPVPVFFAFSKTSQLGAVASNSIVRVWDLKSGEALAVIPISPRVRRVEFVQNGRSLLLLSPDDMPTLVPLNIDGKFANLCSLVYSHIEKNPQAFRYCYRAFESYWNYDAASKHVAPAPWITTVPP